MVGRPTFGWTAPYDDHLLWLWSLRPELPKAIVASRIGVSIETLKHRQAQLALPPRSHGRKSFHSAGLPYHEVGAPIVNCAEERRLISNAVEGSDRLLARLRRYHDLSEIVTVVTRAIAATLPRWPFQVRS